MNESSFMAALTFFINLNETHLFQYLVKEHVVNFVLCWWWNIIPFNNSIILFDKFLSNILFIIQIQQLPWKRNVLKILTLITLCSFLPSDRILVEKFVDRSISCHPLSFFSYFWMKIFCDSAVPVIFILFVFQGIKSFEDSSLFFPFLKTDIGLWFKRVFALFLSI